MGRWLGTDDDGLWLGANDDDHNRSSLGDEEGEIAPLGLVDVGGSTGAHVNIGFAPAWGSEKGMKLIITWGGELGLKRITVDGSDDDNIDPSLGGSAESPSSWGADDGRSRGRAVATGRPGLVFGMLLFGALSNDDGDDDGVEIFSGSAKGTNDDDDGPLGAAKGSLGSDDGATEGANRFMARGGLLGRLDRAGAGEEVGMPFGAAVSSWSLGTAECLLLGLLAAAG